MFDIHSLIVSRDSATSLALFSHFKSFGSVDLNTNPMAFFEGLNLVDKQGFEGHVLCVFRRSQIATRA